MSIDGEVPEIAENINISNLMYNFWKYEEKSELRYLNQAKNWIGNKT